MISLEFVIVVGTVMMMGLTLYGANKLSSYLIDLQLHRVKEKTGSEEDHYLSLAEKDTEHERYRVGKKVSG
ncbi:MAG: hypothetical protein IIZ57_00695 [Solobacterium sp.]|nr:hypothetical protein [Solobacterium sp.]